MRPVAPRVGGAAGRIAAAGLLTVPAVCAFAAALRVRDSCPDLSDNLLLPVVITLPAAVIGWRPILGTVLPE